MREIAKEVHMSFSDISTIIKKEFPEKEQHITKDTEVLKAFAKGEKPLDIAIKFNLPANEVERLHREYRSLAGMDQLNRIYKDLGADIEHFVQLYARMKEQNMGAEETIKWLRCGNDLQLLELKYEKVKEDIKRFEAQKQNLISETENLENVIAISRSIIANLDRTTEKRTNEVKSLNSEKHRLLDIILDLMGSKDYRKIKDIGRQQVETTLKNKRPLLLIALVAIIEAFKLDPEKQILFSNVTSDGYQSYYVEQQIKEFLEIAEQFYDSLADKLVNATMNVAMQ